MLAIAALASLALLLVLLTARWTKNRRRWELLSRIPGPKPWPLLGNARELGAFSSARKHFSPLSVLHQNLEGLAVLYRKEKMFALWLGPSPTVLLFGPENIEPILKSQTQIEKGPMYEMAKDFIGNSIPISGGNTWKTRRKLLNPAFNVKVLESYLPVMNHHARGFLQRVEKDSSTREWLEAFPHCARFAFNVVNETTFGDRLEPDDKGAASYIEALDTVTEIMFSRQTRPITLNQTIFSFTRNFKVYQNKKNFLNDYITKAIEDRTEKRKSLSESCKDQPPDAAPRSFMDFILQYAGTVFNAQDLKDEIGAIVLAAYDTTASGLSFALYSLGLYKEVQTKAREEVEQVFGRDKDRDVTNEDLRRLKYLDCFIKESQRIFTTTAPFFSRMLVEDFEIGGHTVPKGTEVFLAFHLLHHDPDVFPDPEVFDPERFLPENCVGRHPFAYLPFSSGPRSCIGQRYAMMEMKVLLCHALRYFEIHSLDQRDKLIFVPAGVLKTEKPLKMVFTRR